MSKQSRSMQLAVTLLILVIVTGIVYFVWPRPASDHPERITIAQYGDFFLYAPLYIAIDAGFFADVGLDVSLVSTGGDEKTWAAVMSGNASFGLADPTFVAISGERGQAGRVVAMLIGRVPFWGVTFRDDIPQIMQAKDLDGYTVATFPSPSTAFTLQRQMFQDGGLEPRIREGAFGSLFAMLHSGVADIALELEPNVSQAVERQNAKVVYALSTMYGEFANTGLTTTPQMIRDNPDLVQNVVLALERALRLIADDPDHATTLLTKRFPEVGAEIGRQALQRSIDEGVLPRSTITSNVAWDNAIQLRISAGDLSESAPFGVFVDNSFATTASETH